MSLEFDTHHKLIRVRVAQLPPVIRHRFCALVGLPANTLPEIRLIDCERTRQNLGTLANMLLENIIIYE